METVIIGQDRMKLIGYSVTDSLYSVPIVKDGTLYGFNLKLHNEVLGTFDSVKECVKEITNIVNCECEYYCVLGYSDWNIIEHLMIE